MDQTIDFIRFIGVVKSQYKQDLDCSSYKEKTAPQLRRRILQDFTFPCLVFILGRLKQYPKGKRPEHNERSANLICNLVNNRIILSSRYRRYCGSFLWKWINEKYSLFGYIFFFY